MSRHTRATAAARTDGTYERLVAEHGSETCWVCGAAPKKRRLSIDHDHKTMRVRGLLCHRCNRVLWNGVTQEWLRKAYLYLVQTGRIDA